MSEALELMKSDIKQRAQRESNSKLFYETYAALAETLKDTYAECKDIVFSQSPELVSQWHAEMEPFIGKVKSHDHALMLANLKVLKQLKIPQLWIDNKFTPASKRYLWSYLGNLCKFAAGASDVAAPAAPSKARDIRPPAHMPTAALPGIKQIYDELPKNMLTKVKDIAERYSADIENGKTSINDLKFDVISKELFSQIDPDEMQQMVTSVGSMLQGAMQNGDGDMGEMFKTFARCNEVG